MSCVWGFVRGNMLGHVGIYFACSIGPIRNQELVKPKKDHVLLHIKKEKKIPFTGSFLSLGFRLFSFSLKKKKNNFNETGKQKRTFSTEFCHLCDYGVIILIMGA